MTAIVNPAGDQLVISDGITDIANGKYGFTYPHLVTLSSGNVLAFGTGGSGTIARILAPDGSALTGDIQLLAEQETLDVAALPNGGFVAVFEWPGDGEDVRAQIFDSNAQPVGGVIEVTGSQPYYQGEPQVTVLSNGNFVVTWGNPDASTGGGDYGQVYDQTGSSVGSTFFVHSDGLSTTDIAATPDGGFVAVWVGPGEEPSTVGIFGAKFDSDGTKVGSDFVVGQPGIYGESDPSVTVLADGTVAVAFRHVAYPTDIPSPTHPSAVDVWVRLIHADGTLDPIVAVTRPTETTADGNERQEEFPQIVALPDGGFAVGFTSIDSIGGYGLRDYYVATFDGEGNRLTGNQLASARDGTGAWGGLAALADGSVLATWGNGGAHGRLFTPTQLSSNVVEGDDADNVLTGSDANETLNGHGGNDVLDGNGGIDLLRGGDGDDTYIVRTTLSSVIEDVLGGDDTVTATVDYRLAEGIYVDHLVAAAGTAALHLTGNALAQTLTGNDGDNVLDGGGGDDTFAGGAGNDVYIIVGDRTTAYGVDAANIVVENANEGVDEVRVWIGDYTLGANVEKLTGTGDLAQTLAGNELDNVITGGPGDALFGLEGNDTLVRSSYMGTMAGGAGDDLYILDNGSEPITENADEGVDEVRIADGPVTLADNVENLTGLSATGQQLTGNVFANVIKGGSGADYILGKGGDDTLDGGAGGDYMEGGDGDDVYVVDGGDIIVESDASGGHDTVSSSVSYVLGENLEDLTLTGAAALHGTGNELDNVLVGNDAANVMQGNDGNDMLEGAGGNDTLRGGSGIDTVTYEAAAAGVTVNLAVTSSQNTGGAGTDSISGMENLTGSTHDDTLAGYGAVNTLEGLGGNDALTGGGGNDVLLGDGGNDTLNGNGGADAMTGGGGDDLYFVNNAGDTVTESSDGDGHDRVNSSVSFTLGDYVEDLFLTASGTSNAVGNGLDNVLQGNAAANIFKGLAGADTLKGGAGDDSLNGGTGQDTLVGGAGNDKFVFNTGDTSANHALADHITDFASGDRIDLHNIDANTTVGGDQAFTFIGTAGFTAAGQLHYATGGGSTWIEGDTNGDGSADFAIYLVGNHTMAGTDFVL
jgi:Ca2+-binding RTX toxin-like protein